MYEPSEPVQRGGLTAAFLGRQNRTNRSRRRRVHHVGEHDPQRQCHVGVFFENHITANRCGRGVTGVVPLTGSDQSSPASNATATASGFVHAGASGGALVDDDLAVRLADREIGAGHATAWEKSLRAVLGDELQGVKHAAAVANRHNQRAIAPHAADHQIAAVGAQAVRLNAFAE
jgi:hypothetical protein